MWIVQLLVVVALVDPCRVGADEGRGCIYFSSFSSKNSNNAATYFLTKPKIVFVDLHLRNVVLRFEGFN